MVITSPFDDSIDKPTYFEQCWKNADWIERHELEKIFVDGDEAFVTYRCVAKGGSTFRNTEFFVFDGDKVNAYPPGSVIVLPGETWHFHWAKSGEYVTQVTAIGPLGLEYHDPHDDPRRHGP